MPFIVNMFRELFHTTTSKSKGTSYINKERTLLDSERFYNEALTSSDQIVEEVGLGLAQQDFGIDLYREGF